MALRMGCTNAGDLFYSGSGVDSDRMRAAEFAEKACKLGSQTGCVNFGRAILELRRRAQVELGTRFDIKGFHGCVLEHGTITLPMLKEAVGRWLERVKSEH